MKFFLFFLFIFYQSVLFAKELRIVTLAPNLTEIVFALGLGQNIVGDTVQCDYPMQAKTIFKVGDYINPNIERILSVKPNYVLATMGNPLPILNKLEQQGIKVLKIQDPKKANELLILIHDIANEFGVQSQGEKISNQILDAINQLKSHKVTNKKFLFVLQFDPIYSVSDETWVGNLFTLAGYMNVVGKSKISYPVISTEFLIKNKPDIIFTGYDPKLTLDENKKIQFAHLVKIFGQKSAETVQIVFIPKDILVRPGPRIVDGVYFIEGISN
ncbi:MAG: helical backbone metal receptor [Bdellovibrionota bacterium]